MVKDVEIWQDVARAGSYLLAQGLDREHDNVRKLIEKYREDFEDFSDLKTRQLKSTGGRKATEYLLTLDQVTFFFSLIRNNKHTIKLFTEIIKAGNIVKVMAMLNSFDSDDINVRYVYVMQDSMGNLKIGISNDPERRLSEINANNSEPVILLGMKETHAPAYQDETALHNKAREHKIKGEWYTGEALKEIQW